MALLKKNTASGSVEGQPTKIICPVPSNLVVTSPSPTSEDGLRLGSEKQTRCDLLYGPSGAGKTENLGLLALYVWEKYGLITRLISADGGGWGPLNPYVELGIIEPFSLNGAKAPLKVMMAMSKGFWLKDMKGVKTYVPLEQKDLEEHNGKPGVGGWCSEGLTSFARNMFTSLTRRQDIHIPGAPKESFVRDGDDYYGFAGPSHYGFVQNRIEEMVSFSNSLPFKKMMWTALEDQGIDPDTGEDCYGPSIVGKAATGKAPAWFGDCIHLVPMINGEVVADDRKDLGKMQQGKGGVPVKTVRAYLSNHPHPQTGRMFKAKIRTSAWVGKEMPLFFDVIINGNERKGMNWVYQMEDDLATMSSEAITKSLKRPPPSVMYKLQGRSQTGYVMPIDEVPIVAGEEIIINDSSIEESNLGDTEKKEGVEGE